MESEEERFQKMMARAAIQWPFNKAATVTMGLPFARQAGSPPVLGSGTDEGDFTPVTRFTEPNVGDKQHRIDILNGAAELWHYPLNMASRQRKVTYRARELAGFGDGPITLHVDWGEFGKSLFTWRGGEDEGWIMGEPK